MGLLDNEKYKLREAQQGLSDQYQSPVMRGLLNYPDFGMRYDNSGPKGLGYFGQIPTAEKPPYQQSYMTEYSMGVPIAGREQEIPSLVPSLVPQEIDWIRNTGELTDEIKRKAYANALMRLGNGLSPFAD